MSFAAVLGLLTLVFSFPLVAAQASEATRYQAVAPPVVSAKAVFVLDATAQTELYALNADEPLPPASLTKVAAALVILDRVDLEDMIEIEQEDLVPPEESQVGLIAGDTLSARDLLFGVLIPSGSDATLALARHVGEGVLGAEATHEEAVDEFVALMNAKAQELGASKSHFVYPTGIDADGHVMSARDVARFTEAALQNPLFAEIVSTPSAVLESEMRPEGYTINSTNSLLVEGLVTGVKTGTTPEAGGCLVTSYAIGPNQIISVVLGSDVLESPEGQPDNTARFADTRALMAAAREDYVWLDPGAPGEIAGLSEELQVWDVTLDDVALLPAPADDVAAIRYRLVLGPPGEPQSAAGHVQFYAGDILLSERTALQAR